MTASKDIAILLTPVLPLPNRSGRALRAWDWLIELSRTHLVHVWVTNGFDDQDITPNYPAAGVWSISNGIFVPNRLLRFIGVLFPPCGLLFRGLVVDWLYPQSNTTARTLLNQMENKPIKRIVVFRFYLHDLGRAIASLCPDTTLELDMDDLESATRLSVARCLARMGRPRESLRSFMGSVQYALLERFIVNGYDAVWLAANMDAQRLINRGIPNVGTRPNRIKSPRHISNRGLSQPNNARFLFVGSLDYPPNQEAVLFLLNQIKPILEQSLTRPWTFRVLGRRAPKDLINRMESSDRIEFFPNADDLADHYAQANVVLVPLLAGGGTKLKTIEAFSHRRPVISTLEGVRGLTVEPGVHYLHAQTGAEFAKAITQLMRDLTLAHRVSKAGETFYFQQHQLA
jgi:glycosyltransferase involved in cell wall biosynthesis